MVTQSKKNIKVLKPDLSRTLLLYLVGISITSILVIGTVWIYSEVSAFQTTSRQMRERFVDEKKALLKLEVESAVSYLKYMMAQTEDRLRHSIKAKVYEAHAVASNLYLRHRDRMPIGQLKTLIKDALRPIRFNLGRGYFSRQIWTGLNIFLPTGPSWRQKHARSQRRAG